MSRFLEFYNNYIARLKLNKYCLVIIIFIIIISTIGDSNFYNRYMYDNKIRELEKEIKYYQKEIEHSQNKLYDIQLNRWLLEQYIREEYLMKKPNEDIYIIIDKWINISEQ